MIVEGICLLLTVVMTSGLKYHHNPFHFPDGSGVLYDPLSQKCCRGVAYPKTRASYILCCGNSTYDITEQICCQGNALPLTYKTRTACCGRKTYDVKEALCCAGKIAKDFPAADLQHYTCRGRIAVDTRNSENEVEPEDEMGYGDHYGPRPYPRPYSPYNYPGRFTICNGKTFNTTTHACCNNILKESPMPHAGCCGADKLYDTKKQVCCPNLDGTWKLSDKPPRNPDTPDFYYSMGAACCGGVAYDRSTAICCKGTIMKIPDGEKRWQYRCCGDKMIDSSTHTCCDGETATEIVDGMTGCCGNKTYSYKNQVCCYKKEGTKIFDRQENSRSHCCGGELIDRTTHLCCYNYLVGPDGSHEMAVKKTNKHTQCCGSESYDFTKQICCGGSVALKITDGIHQQCCGNRTYNPKSHICCDRKVMEVTNESKRSCCSIYASDDYMTGCFGMNRPHLRYRPSMYHTMGGASSEEESEGEGTTPAAAITEAAA